MIAKLLVGDLPPERPTPEVLKQLVFRIEVGDLTGNTTAPGQAVEDLRKKQLSDMLSKAEALLAKGRYDSAIKLFQQAKAMAPEQSREIDQRLVKANYKKYLEIGRLSLHNGDVDTARAYFRKAQEYLDTTEVRSLLRQIHGQQ